MNLVYIGEKFYRDSLTLMSSIYEVQGPGKGYRRSDWGEVVVALQHGISVTIRPATEVQLHYFNSMLHKYR